MLPYALIRSRRKTIAIHITKDATVEVRVPMKTSKADIDRFVASKADWIVDHLTQRKRRNEEAAAFALNYGATVLYRGAPYPIQARAGRKAGFDGDCFYMPPDLPSDAIKASLIKTYKAFAKEILTEKTHEYAKRMAVVPAAIKINSAKTRWGSCSGKKSINYSWRLVMADDSVIDYVVVHELAHIREHNHSPRFWAIVENALPDYKQRQKRLKELQVKLSREDWD